jgi:N-acetylglutamate synthase-like GNAT family acetyltransferase
MDSNDFTIRPARLDESDLLSHIRFRARSYWEYPRGLLSHWLESGEFSISPEEIEGNLTYVAEDEEEGEVLGFYSIRVSGPECEMKCLSILPEFLGTDMRTALFFHACETAEAAGAKFMTVVSDPFSSGFYEEMGAEQTGEVSFPGADFVMPVLRLELQAAD